MLHSGTRDFSQFVPLKTTIDDWNGNNYHTANDKMSTLNFTYLTNYVKASIGTTAHLAPEPRGMLQLVCGPRSADCALPAARSLTEAHRPRVFLFVSV